MQLSPEESRLQAAEAFRNEMEALGQSVRDLVVRQPPIQLLGYLLAQFHMAIMLPAQTSEDEPRPDKDTLKTFQFALEYLHGVWSTHGSLLPESTPFDEDLAGELMQVLAQLEEKTMWYCMASSQTRTEFQAKSTWALIRGHRYQVLEEEFFHFVLAPHDAALRQAYGIGSDDVAAGIQNISDAFRTGFSTAANKLMERMDDTYRMVEESGEELETVLERLKTEDSSFSSEMSSIMHDMFFAGVCNLSRHSGLPRQLLEDLSYEPGQNDKFFAEGAFSGTPMRTLPARIRPGIRLGEDFFATDGQFVRDSAYRAIQWGLWRRLPYRDEWLKRQGQAVEQAYPVIFSSQLKGAQKFESVFYRDVGSGEWVETDLLMILADALLVVEAKAGVMPMQSPATNFTSHERVIHDLIAEAYRQCKRFLEYLSSAPEVALYNLVAGEYVEVGRIRQEQFRLILPIGLTVEAFTPFSTMAKELPEVEPILGRHPFISMSVDDLFVLSRFLPTTGELLHYLEVRQQVAGLEGALLFDETDHLGAYIANNRFDMNIREQLKTADQVAWDGFSDKVDRYFEGEDWQAVPPPSQTFPAALKSLLDALDNFRPTGWLQFDGLLRDFGHEGRENIGQYLDELLPSLADHPRRRFQIGVDPPIQFWLHRDGAEPESEAVRIQARVGCLTVGALEMRSLLVAYDSSRTITGIRCETHAAPTVLQPDYSALLEEAERQRVRMVALS